MHPGHLRHAIELSERFRDYAMNDPDLDRIRDEGGFAELVGGSDTPAAAGA